MRWGRKDTKPQTSFFPSSRISLSDQVGFVPFQDSRSSIWQRGLFKLIATQFPTKCYLIAQVGYFGLPRGCALCRWQLLTFKNWHLKFSNALGLVVTVLKSAATSSRLCCQPFAIPPLKNACDPPLKLLKNTFLTYIPAKENGVRHSNATGKEKNNYLIFPFRAVWPIRSTTLRTLSFYHFDKPQDRSHIPKGLETVTKSNRTFT